VLTFDAAKVDDFEKQHGWSITGVSKSQISMTYRKEIELVFDASSFKPNGSDAAPLQPVNSRIDLWYVAANRELNPMPLTVEKDFFLQNIREYCRCLPQAETTVKELLDAVSASWTRAMGVANDIKPLTCIACHEGRHSVQYPCIKQPEGPCHEAGPGLHSCLW
jgi:kinetochore protein Spc7/SPC105